MMPTNARRSPVPASPFGETAPRLRVEAVGSTDVGLLRASNEDRFGLFDELGLFMVADGIGGEVCGEVAAQLAVDTVAQVFAERAKADPTERLPSMTGFIDAVRIANERILASAAADPHRHGMGTTFAGVLARLDHACVVHVGDSRVYRLRHGELTRLTDDHTVVATAVRQGIPRHEAEILPSANALMRSLGTVHRAAPDARLDRAVAGDIVLLCTDGITCVLEDDEIRDVLASRRDLAEMANQLIAMAIDEGGPDNATCVLLRWVDASDAPESRVVPTPKRGRCAD